MKPILPLHLRAAQLAGVAIVERAGPEMLRMLRGHMIGETGRDSATPPRTLRHLGLHQYGAPNRAAFLEDGEVEPGRRCGLHRTDGPNVLRDKLLDGKLTTSTDLMSIES